VALGLFSIAVVCRNSFSLYYWRYLCCTTFVWWRIQH